MIKKFDGTVAFTSGEFEKLKTLFAMVEASEIIEGLHKSAYVTLSERLDTLETQVGAEGHHTVWIERRTGERRNIIGGRRLVHSERRKTKQ